MPAPAVAKAVSADLVSDYESAMQHAGRKTGRSTMQAARSFCTKVDRVGGFDRMSPARQLDTIAKARSFASWMMVTGRLRVDAAIFGRVDLWLGAAARAFCPDAHGWFVEAGQRVDIAAPDEAWDGAGRRPGGAAQVRR